MVMGSKTMNGSVDTEETVIAQILNKNQIHIMEPFQPLPPFNL